MLVGVTLPRTAVQWNWWLACIVLVALSVWSSATHAQNPDPRDYEIGHFVPNRTIVIHTYLRHLSASEGRDYSAQALALRATYILKVGKFAIVPFDAILPVQDISVYTPVSQLSAAAPPLALVPQDLKLTLHATGMADFVFLPTIGYEFVQNAQDHTHTWMAATIYVTAPTGSYDKDRLLNVGGNRWIFNPLVTIGQRFLRAFTIEASANISAYTQNSDYRSAQLLGQLLKLKQKPSFGGAVHFGVDFHPRYFSALSYLINAGGERTVDVAGQGEVVESKQLVVHSLRANLGMRITPQTLLLAQWQEDVGGSKGSVQGRFFGLRVTHVFFSPEDKPATRQPITDPAAKVAK